LSSPSLSMVEKHAAYAFALVTWIDCELMRRCNLRAGEVLAFVLLVCWLDNDSSHQRALADNDKALTTLNSLGCDFSRLIDGGVVQAHASKLCVRPMKQRSEIVNGIGFFEQSDAKHGCC